MSNTTTIFTLCDHCDHATAWHRNVNTRVSSTKGHVIRGTTNYTDSNQLPQSIQLAQLTPVTTANNTDDEDEDWDQLEDDIEHERPIYPSTILATPCEECGYTTTWRPIGYHVAIADTEADLSDMELEAKDNTAVTDFSELRRRIQRLGEVADRQGYALWMKKRGGEGVEIWPELGNITPSWRCESLPCTVTGILSKSLLDDNEDDEEEDEEDSLGGASDVLDGVEQEFESLRAELKAALTAQEKLERHNEALLNMLRANRICAPINSEEVDIGRAVVELQEQLSIRACSKQGDVVAEKIVKEEIQVKTEGIEKVTTTVQKNKAVKTPSDEGSAWWKWSLIWIPIWLLMVEEYAWAFVTVWVLVACM
ncbi:hypothetical protein BJ508DRAFT_305235 [Ascobolus immersus RN42]|uniref:Uncharacterized protein n=1 Tax=Ascobolus immersus RN42 TaxID=1160509 RepID=A0A3N4IA42_ASCIM|nr:hypothetical protein BJ508DRAFT_305235 [Ascobolus immersus RN42]